VTDRESGNDEVRRDALVSAMAHEIVDGDVVGVGLGTPLAVAAALLARASHAPDSHVLVGGAVDPEVDLAGALGGSAAIAGRTSGYVPHVDTMEMAERQAMTLQFIRPAQVDARGQTNVSRILRGDGRPLRLPGGLALADVPALLPRLVVFLPQHRRRSLVATVDRVTGGGGWDRPPHRAAGVVAIISDLAVIRIEPEGPRLQARLPGVSVEQVVEETGFELRGTDDAGVYEVSDQHRAALAEIDPGGIRFDAT
jgi:glutaconate CoA-transferase, subunit B